MKKRRIVKRGNQYVPQYYHRLWGWQDYTLEDCPCYWSFNSLEEAEKFLEVDKPEDEVVKEYS